MYSNDEIKLIVLDSFAKLTYKTKYELLDGFNLSDPLFKKYEQNLIKTLSEGVYNKIRESFFSKEYANELLKTYEEQNIIAVTYRSKLYPEQLKYIPAPPMVLYCKGNTSLLQSRLFAVVGSRRASPYAIQNCKKITEELTNVFTAVTGLADGSDTATIKTALSSGKIICVLAHGFDYVYPAINKNILDEVIKCGLAITEHIPSVQPRKYLFPVRNRIIAGLSEGVLVTAAGAKSGALITADYAFEYGKEVFAFPYNINVTSGAGGNALIKRGANLTENILDITSVFGLDFNSLKSVTLSGEEKIILDEIRKQGEVHVDVLCAKLNKKAFELIPALSSLEVKKLIVRLGGNRYSAV